MKIAIICVGVVTLRFCTVPRELKQNTCEPCFSICVTFRVNYMWGFDMWTWEVLIFVFLSWWVYMVLIHGNKTTYSNDAYMRF